MTEINYKNMIVYLLNGITDEKNILEYDIKPSFSIYHNMPLLKYGFQFYIHQTKSKMSILDSAELKTTDFYKIVMPFEDYIPKENYKKETKNQTIKLLDDINTVSIKYFKFDKIISRAFYKLWEILMIFNIVPDSDNFTSFSLAEAPGSFAQSIIFYRNKFYNQDKIKKDKYYATSINIENSKDFVSSFNNYLLKLENFKIWQYKNSDITDIDVANKLISEYKNSIDLITADGGFNWISENYQEQEAYILLLSEIYCALNIQKIGGNFIIKFYETYTELSLKFIEILRRFYSTVYIYKPLFSKMSSSEKYIVCLNFSNKNIKYINKLLEIILAIKYNKNYYIHDIFPDYKINSDLILMNIISSKEISNNQFVIINKIIKYINDGNYYGNQYNLYLENRKQANDFWISLFFPFNQDLKQIKSRLIKIINEKLYFNENILKKLSTSIS